MIQGTFLKIPQNGDRGSVFGPALAENQTILDSHSHNGVNSPLINAKSITKSTIDLLAANWVNTGTDYKQLVTLPSGFDFDLTSIKVIIMSGSNIGAVFTPTINKVSPTTFDLHCIYGDVDIKVVIS